MEKLATINKRTAIGRYTRVAHRRFAFPAFPRSACRIPGMHLSDLIELE